MGTKLPERFRVIFLGERKIAMAALQMLAKDEEKKFDIRALVGNETTLSTYNRLLPGKKVIFLDNKQRHAEVIANTIIKEKINLLISVQHNWILPQFILELIGGLTFNLHNAKLPDYKGYNSISHALLNAEKTFTSTIHWMAPEVDSGDIAFTKDVDINEDDTALSLYLRSVDAAIGAFGQLLSALRSGADIPHIPLFGEGIFYHRDDIASYADVTEISDPEELDRRARALFFPPINAAYKRLSGDKRVWVLPDTGYRGLLGTLLPANRTPL